MLMTDRNVIGDVGVGAQDPPEGRLADSLRARIFNHRNRHTMIR
jgi:hypothetical protein